MFINSKQSCSNWEGDDAKCQPQSRMNSVTGAAGKGFDGAINFLVVVGWPTSPDIAHGSKKFD